MKKTYTTLSDGRALIYYDADGSGDGSDNGDFDADGFEAGGSDVDGSGAGGSEADGSDVRDPVRDHPDRRGLPPITTLSERRYDQLLDEWVMVASHRQGRTHLPPADQCPLCPSRPGRPSEIPAPDYQVAVFENRFPALSGSGAGSCEVVCFSPHHDASFADLSPAQVRTVIAAWTDRTRDLAEVPGIEQVYCFENRGREIGVTLPHPHGQIYALPVLTPRTRRTLESVARHWDATGRNLFDEVRDTALADGRRVVLAGDHWSAFVPHAARWPYEVHLYPHRRVPDLLALDDAERDELAHVYLDLLGRFDRLFPSPAPYISAWHQAPVRTGRDQYALHLELFTIRRAADKLKYLAGTESGMGLFVNDITPEQAAARLREV
ncbi:galactose-1-phosphate uridylyltransferase [Streptomyces sp. ISL-86]|nr:galactose-1-phosphate uridylyltransferase [Streptomyces sp. ISL-86]MBT2459007.1 galactose-1-phosphate uridylyltransferase [Streptomyces sp. ISL-86]